MPRTDRPYTTRRSSPLAELRVRAKLTAAAAAERIGIAASSLGNIERGSVPASDQVQEKMAEAYGVSMVSLRRAYVASRREFIVREGPRV